MTKKTKLWLCSALLAILILLPYLQMQSHEFINWDDPYYVYNNPLVSDGLSWLGIGWAFTTCLTANWHPLTWISHMLDSSLFGPTPQAAHMVNIIWYIGCVLLAFFLFLRLGSSITAAFFMASFFGLHPLHVESVAWAAERKDLLCAFFFLSATLTYLNYTCQKKLSLYLLTTAFFLLSLLSKPMAVTWPFVALLLDYWPLKRLNNELKRTIYEKIPWIVLTVFSSIVTLVAQNKSNAVKSLVEFSFVDRMGNVVISYLIYMKQSIWPVWLTVYYPYPYYISTISFIVACLILGMITLTVFWQRQKHPYLLLGWLYYLGVLFPVIGIIQIGIQAHADRYMLLPQLGLILGTGFFLDNHISKINFRRITAMVITIVIIILMILTFRQVSYWKNSQTLFNQNLAVAGENELAHFNLGSAYLENNEFEPAIIHLSAAANMNPEEVTTYNNMGLAYAGMNETSLAEACFKKAILINPQKAQPHFHLAVIRMQQGRFKEATDHLNKAVRLSPEWEDARNLRDKAKDLSSKPSSKTVKGNLIIRH